MLIEMSAILFSEQETDEQQALFFFSWSYLAFLGLFCTVR